MAKLKNSSSKKSLDVLKIIEDRFHKNLYRHPEITWKSIQIKLAKKPHVLESILMMEATGGEPDVVQFNDRLKSLVFVDCSVETPKGRVSLCYDKQALMSRKENKPKGSALELAAKMGVTLLSEQQYQYLQSLGDFDCKTSSWIATPAELRSLGGALFGDKRYSRTFFYHNGAQSYYSSRGFRAFIEI